MSGSKPRLAFLGMGIMGKHMVANLAKTGAELTIWNRTPHPSLKDLASSIKAQFEPDLQKAIENADMVFTCVTGPADLRQVLIESGVTFKRNAIVIDCSTVGPNAAKAIARDLAQHQIRFMDAPVTGGDIGAKNGTLTFMVGGNQKDLDECSTFLHAMGKTVSLAGPVGSGQALKLCNQILCSVNLIAVCESFKLAESLGLDPKLVVDVCGGGAGGSWSLANVGSKIVQNDFEPGFMVKDMMKDLNFVHEIAPELPGVSLAIGNFEEAIEQMGEAAAKLGTQAMAAAYSDVGGS